VHGAAAERRDFDYVKNPADLPETKHPAPMTALRPSDGIEALRSKLRRIFDP
jgi:hypothetical protein